MNLFVIVNENGVESVMVIIVDDYVSAGICACKCECVWNIECCNLVIYHFLFLSICIFG